MFVIRIGFTVFLMLDPRVGIERGEREGRSKKLRVRGYFCPKTTSFFTATHVTGPHLTPSPRLRISATSLPVVRHARAKVSEARQKNTYRYSASATPPPCGHDSHAPSKSPEYSTSWARRKG